MENGDGKRMRSMYGENQEGHKMEGQGRKGR